ncbi:hypothetical protein GRJ2_002520700 [Grus japonensis]|uniref:Uncharacterized protein n=1 Tax=Grus japonensis TaxID=30415 RepID=A0ABC9XSZ5_GRUJA
MPSPVAQLPPGGMKMDWGMQRGTSDEELEAPSCSGYPLIFKTLNAHLNDAISVFRFKARKIVSEKLTMGCPEYLQDSRPYICNVAVEKKSRVSSSFEPPTNCS